MYDISIFGLNINTSMELFDKLSIMPVKEKGSYKISMDDTPGTEQIAVAENCKYIDIDHTIRNNIWLKIKSNPIHDVKYTNCIGYPPNGGMDWHTNGNDPGIRIYLSWSENGNSGMVWYKNNQIIVDKDNIGFNIRQFKTPCWHKVWSKCYRLSLGFKIL